MQDAIKPGRGWGKLGDVAHFVNVVVSRSQPLPEVDIPLCEPQFNDGEMFFVFSKAEIKQSTEPFRFFVALKFLRCHPSLDHVRGYIKTRWELKSMLVVGQLRNPSNVLVQLANKDDFVTVMSQGNAEMEGVSYGVFHWTEEEDSPLVLIWIMLPGLPPNYFHISILKSTSGGFGRFFKRVMLRAV